MSEQLGLFGPPEPVAVAAPKPLKGVRWFDYRVIKPEKCAHCLLAAHQARNNAWQPNLQTARFRRQADDGDLLLCRDHAGIKKSADLAAGLIGKGRKTAAPTTKKRRHVA